MTSTAPMKITPLPVIDPDLNVHDAAEVFKAKDNYFREQLVRTEEILVLRDKLRWCYRREGVNHLQNCRYLSVQYLDLIGEMKDGWIKPFVLPLPKEAPAAADGH